MSRSKRYQITLTPLDTFFFGGEKTFGMGENENYLIRSKRFPQQTTLLGMMRKTLLEQCGLLGPPDWKVSDDAAARAIIGKQSFHLDGSSSTMNFGAINQLSPVFLVKNGQKYVPCPLDKGYTAGWEQGHALFTNAGGIKKSIPVLHGYNQKTGLGTQWIAENGNCETEDNIFDVSSRPGVWKGATGEEDEEGYYKEYFLKFSGPWSYAFYIELDESTITEDCKKAFGEGLKPAFVTMGKERSSFKMEAAPLKKDTVENLFFPKNLNLIQTANDEKKIVLLSDTFTSNAIYKDCFFGITKTSDFRFISSTIGKTKHYANLTDKKEHYKAPLKSTKFNLLKRGTVLYVNPDNLNKVKERLDHDRFRQIGYNWYGINEASFEPRKKYV